MAEEIITNALQSLAANVETTIKEYFDEKITKEDKKSDIINHITVAKLRIDKAVKSIINEDEPKPHFRSRH